MYRPSSEAQRRREEAQRNRRRLDYYREKQTRALVKFLDCEEITIDSVPRSMWERRQAY